MHIWSSSVSEKGQVTLPKSVRGILGINKPGQLVGFVVEGDSIKLTRAKVVKDTSITEDEMAMMAQWSKKGNGRKVFKTTKSALKHLWSL